MRQHTCRRAEEAKPVNCARGSSCKLLSLVPAAPGVRVQGEDREEGQQVPRDLGQGAAHLRLMGVKHISFLKLLLHMHGFVVHAACCRCCGGGMRQRSILGMQQLLWLAGRSSGVPRSCGSGSGSGSGSMAAGPVLPKSAGCATTHAPAVGSCGRNVLDVAAVLRSAAWRGSLQSTLDGCRCWAGRRPAVRCGADSRTWSGERSWTRGFQPCRQHGVRCTSTWRPASIAARRRISSGQPGVAAAGGRAAPAALGGRVLQSVCLVLRLHAIHLGLRVLSAATSAAVTACR